MGLQLAPRARVQLAAAQAGELHREEVVARGDAGATVVDHLTWHMAAERLLEVALQVLRRLEAPIAADVVHVEAVERTWNAAGHRIDRLLLAAIAHGCPRIEQHAFAQR